MNKPLNKYFDHTNLKPNAVKADIEKLCQEAKQYQFATVCVNPYWVSFAANLLQNSGVGITTVIGFPLGANTTSTKVFETQQALKDGATEIDMVINVGALIDQNDELVLNEIIQIKQACGTKPLKVILETGFLNDEQIQKASELAKQGNADFVKTSTGFGLRGASLNDLKVMKTAINTDLEIKASGGIRTLSDAQAMIEAGASRIGSSNSVAIMAESEKN